MQLKWQLWIGFPELSVSNSDYSQIKEKNKKTKRPSFPQELVGIVFLGALTGEPSSPLPAPPNPSHGQRAGSFYASGPISTSKVPQTRERYVCD